MKINRLTLAIALISAFLVGSFFKDLSQQQPTETKDEQLTVGVLQYVSHPALDEIYRGLKAGLEERGYQPGENIELLFQNGQGDQSKLATMSQQLIQKKADVLVGIATPAAQALANTTQDVPIVLGAVTDPVSAGLVTSNEHPTGNITGVSDQSPVAAQMELAQKLLPEAKTMGILYASAEQNSQFQVERAKEVAEQSGLTVKTFAVPSSNEIAQTVQVMSPQVDFIYIPTDNTIANGMQTVVNEANKTKTPIIPSVDTMVAQGGLATVGINQYELGVQTGRMVADILAGKKPTEMPIYTFDSGDIILNPEQAAFLGITFPTDLQTQATLVSQTE